MIAKLVFKTWFAQLGLVTVALAIAMLLEMLIAPHMKKKKSREKAKASVVSFGICLAFIGLVSIPYMIDMITQNTEQKLAEVIYIGEPDYSRSNPDRPVYSYDVMIDGKKRGLLSLESYAKELDLQEGEMYVITYCQCSKLIVEAERVETETLLE